jgi:4-amino-4-deoxy-L-arabinose transferase-like glycosyltransferase
MKLLDGIGAQHGYGPARGLSALWSAIDCALLVPFGARLYRLRAGVLAGAIAALLPPLVAHGQIVGHESPTLLW